MAIEVKKQMIDIHHKKLTVSRQCELIELSHSSYYFEPQQLTAENHKVMRRMDEIFTEHPYYWNQSYDACSEG